jgi:hypothetical protein
MPAFRDDLDLCWRTHLSGGRVLVVPQARVRHFAAAASRSRRTRAVGHPRYLIERHTIAAMLKATSLRKLPLAVLLALVGGAAALGQPGPDRPAGRRPGRAVGLGLERQGAPGHDRPPPPPQRQRKVDDSALAPCAPPAASTALPAPGHPGAGLRGRGGAHVAQRTDDTGEEQDMPSDRRLGLRVVASHPVAFMVAGFALVMAVSLRSVLFAPAIASIGLGDLAGHRHRAAAEFTSSFHQARWAPPPRRPRRWPCSGACRC